MAFHHAPALRGGNSRAGTLSGVLILSRWCTCSDDGSTGSGALPCSAATKHHTSGVRTENRNVFPHGSRATGLRWRHGRGHPPSEGSRAVSPCSTPRSRLCCCWQSPASLGLETRHSDLCFHHHMVLSMSLSSSYKKILLDQGPLQCDLILVKHIVATLTLRFGEGHGLAALPSP